ncbi:WSC domain-containing protein [Xylariales sp. AK1849]|nr:WSC domain-containing protein [Xylariales sp. AK1849]
MRSFTTNISLIISAAVLVVAVDPAMFTGTPTVGQTSNNYKYLGCAAEIPGRVLTGSSYSDDSMTLESCAAYCVKNSFGIMGVEYGRECYCGKWMVPTATMTPVSDCNMACKGNNKQLCGGNARMSIFNSTTFAAPKPPSTVGSWTYESCYMEPQYGRALGTLVKADDSMTISMCTTACQSAGFNYAGLEYGRECWCGATKPNDLEDASDPSCAMQCDMLCGGDPKQICGGRGALGIYKKNGAARRRHDNDDYHDYGHGPVKDAAARKGRFIKVRRPAARKDKK